MVMSTNAESGIIERRFDQCLAYPSEPNKNVSQSNLGRVIILDDSSLDPDHDVRSVFFQVFFSSYCIVQKVMPRILFVSGFNASTRAKDLAYEFEQ
jgi:hypothetical protein